MGLRFLKPRWGDLGEEPGLRTTWFFLFGGECLSYSIGIRGFGSRLCGCLSGRQQSFAWDSVEGGTGAVFLFWIFREREIVKVSFEAGLKDPRGLGREWSPHFIQSLFAAAPPGGPNPVSSVEEVSGSPAALAAAKLDGGRLSTSLRLQVSHVGCSLFVGTHKCSTPTLRFS